MVNGRRAAGWVVGGVAALVLSGCSSSEPGEPVAALTSAAAPSSLAAVAPSENPPARPIPDAIPATAFLQAADAPGKAKEKPSRLGAGDQELPVFCKTSYEQKDQVGVRATQQLLIASKDAPEGSTPKAAVYEDVIVYRGDGATAFMASLRKAVESCATQKDDSGVTLTNFLRGSIDAGDDAVLVERTRPATDDAGEPVPGQVHSLFWAAVRQGDTIAFVSNTGWESGSAEKADTVTLATRAAARIKAWRG